MRNVFVRCIRFNLQSYVIDLQRVMFADLKNDDERDRKESNEGCQDAAEARAVARARNESSTRRLPVISRLHF